MKFTRVKSGVNAQWKLWLAQISEKFLSWRANQKEKGIRALTRTSLQIADPFLFNDWFFNSWKRLSINSYDLRIILSIASKLILLFVNLRTSEVILFSNFIFFYWHFVEILWTFIFLVFYKLFLSFSFMFQQTAINNRFFFLFLSSNR